MPAIKKFVHLEKDEFWDWTIKNIYDEEVGVVEVEKDPKKVSYNMHSETFYDAGCLRQIADILDGIAKEKKIKSIPLTEYELKLTVGSAVGSGSIKFYRQWRKYCFYPSSEMDEWISYDSQQLRILADWLDEVAKKRTHRK